MRRWLPLLVLPLLAAPALAQGNCSDGTTGVIVSLEPVDIQPDTVRVCFALEGNPNETLKGLGFTVYYASSHPQIWEPEAIPPDSPYHAPPYETYVVLIPEDDDRFFPRIDAV